jgi:protein-S-isoprenylcysteine O-methyltransferase Ste14
MGLDLRWPIGLMFTLVGAMLVIFGLSTRGDAELYKRSLDININLNWGVLLLIFGVIMLFFAWRGGKNAKPGDPTGKP